MEEKGRKQVLEEIKSEQKWKEFVDNQAILENYKAHGESLLPVLEYFKTLLSDKEGPSVPIDLGRITRTLESIIYYYWKDEKIVIEACKMLATVAANSQTSPISKQRAETIFVYIINSHSASIELLSQGLQGLVNTTTWAGLSSGLFTLSLAERLMDLMDLTDTINQEPHKSCHEFAIKVLFNVLRKSEILREIGPIPILQRMLRYIDRPLHFRDQELFHWALRIINTSTSFRYADIFVPFLRDNFAFVKKIISFIDVPFFALKACNIVGNLMSIDNEDLSILILSETDYLDKLYNVIRSSKDDQLLCEVCYDISNITGGTVMKHIELVVYHDIFSELIALAKSGAPKIRKEAGWAVANTAKHPDVSLHERLMELGIVELICELMAVKELELYLVCLQACGSMMFEMEAVVDNETIIYNPVAIRIGECGGIETMEAGIVNCPQAAELERNIMKMYFGKSYEDFLARRRGLKLKRAV